MAERYRIRLTVDVKEYGLKKNQVILRTGDGERPPMHSVEWTESAWCKGRQGTLHEREFEKC